MFKKSLVLGFFAVLGLSFVSRSEICCMFSASKYFGWPNAYLYLNKETDNLKEAKKVETESAINLLEDGWKLRVGSDAVGKFGFTSNGYINFGLNLIIFTGIFWILINLVKLESLK